MNKEVINFTVIILLTSLIVTAGIVLTKEYEDSSEIKGTIGGVEKTLKQAINEGLLINDKLNPRISLEYTNQIDRGHNLDEILVSINGTEMTLREAIGMQDLCGIRTEPTIYQTSMDPGHEASEVEINISGQVKSLQDAINEGKVLYTVNSTIGCYDEDVYAHDSCNRPGLKKEECGDNQSVTSWSDWYCQSSTTTRRDETKFDTIRGCSAGSCYTNTPSEIIDFQTRGCSGTCEGGDCYGDWINLKAGDTCNSDGNNPYTCSSWSNQSCIDQKTEGNGFVTVYYYRKITCYSTHPSEQPVSQRF